MKIPARKLKALLLYFTLHTEPRLLGKTKLMKLIYFADFLHLKRYGALITYDKYYHLEYGPVPTTIKNLVDSADSDVDNSILADTIKITRHSEQMRIEPLRTFSESDKNLFSDSELRTLERVCARFSSTNTRDIVEASHLEAPWRDTEELEEIPFKLALEDPDCEISKADFELFKLLNQQVC